MLTQKILNSFGNIIVSFMCQNVNKNRSARNDKKRENRRFSRQLFSNYFCRFYFLRSASAAEMVAFFSPTTSYPSIGKMESSARIPGSAV